MIDRAQLLEEAIRAELRAIFLRQTAKQVTMRPMDCGGIDWTVVLGDARPVAFISPGCELEQGPADPVLMAFAGVPLMDLVSAVVIESTGHTWLDRRYRELFGHE